MQHKELYVRAYTYLSALLLLVLTVMSDFISKTVNKDTQKILVNNLLARNIVLYMLIFFTLDFTSITTNPTQRIIDSAYIWFIFVLFNQMDYRYTIFSLISLSIIYLIDSYVQYYTKFDCPDECQRNIQKAQRLKKYGIIFLCITIIIGFIVNAQARYSKNKNISMKTIFFG